MKFEIEFGGVCWFSDFGDASASASASLGG